MAKKSRDCQGLDGREVSHEQIDEREGVTRGDRGALRQAYGITEGWRSRLAKLEQSRRAGDPANKAKAIWDLFAEAESCNGAGLLLLYRGMALTHPGINNMCRQQFADASSGPVSVCGVLGVSAQDAILKLAIYIGDSLTQMFNIPIQQVEEVTEAEGIPVGAVVPVKEGLDYVVVAPGAEWVPFGLHQEIVTPGLVQEKVASLAIPELDLDSLSWAEVALEREYTVADFRLKMRTGDGQRSTDGALSEGPLSEPLTIGEIGAALGINRKTAKRWLDKNALPAIPVGTRYKIPLTLLSGMARQRPN